MFIKLINQLQYDWKFSLKTVQMIYFWINSSNNIKTDKRPPKMIYLSAMGAYWNEYGSLFDRVKFTGCFMSHRPFYAAYLLFINFSFTSMKN